LGVSLTRQPQLSQRNLIFPHLLRHCENGKKKLSSIQSTSISCYKMWHNSLSLSLSIYIYIYI
jgi:hypothetical protein